MLKEIALNILTTVFYVITLLKPSDITLTAKIQVEEEFHEPD
jgi:hypothetical protein